MSRVVDVAREVDTGMGENVAQEGKLGDASVLYLDVTEAVESLLVGVIEQAEGIEEAKRGLGSKLGLEGVEGRGSLGHGSGGERGGRADKGWEEWNGPLTSNIDSTIKAFFFSLLTTADITPDIPKYSILISQLGIRAGDLGILCPRTHAAPDFAITMASARRNALHGFRIHKNLPNFPIHQTIGVLF